MTDPAASRLYGLLFGSLGSKEAHSIMLVNLSDCESATRIAANLSQAMVSHGNRVLLVGVNDTDKSVGRFLGATETDGAMELDYTYPNGATITSLENVGYVGFDMSTVSIKRLSNYFTTAINAGVSVIAVVSLDSAIPVSSVCEATVITVVHGKTSRSLAKEVAQDLEAAKANVIGVVSA